jgi:hypothetical protein
VERSVNEVKGIYNNEQDYPKSNSDFGNQKTNVFSKTSSII